MEDAHRAARRRLLDQLKGSGNEAMLAKSVADLSLSVRARTTYLARIKNPNPALLAVSPVEKTKVGQGSKTRPIHTDSGHGHE